MVDGDAHTENEKAFNKYFYNMENKVDKLFVDYEKKLIKKEKKEDKEEDNA